MTEYGFVDGGFKITYMAIVHDPGFSAYQGRIKIGDATYHTNKTLDEIKQEALSTNPELFKQGFITTPEIEAAAEKRVKDWSGTADLPTQIVFTSLNVRETVNNYGKKVHEGFRDYQIHNVLVRSGFQKAFVRKDKKNGEWFNINLTDAIAGYKAYLNGKGSFGRSDEVRVPINLRDEQLNAVKRTKKHFTKGTVEKPKTFLWNAIMRFGKTLTAYKLVQDMYEKDENFKKVLVITHRPVVSAGWSEDFFKIFGHDSEWQFGAKKKEYGLNWEELNRDNPFVYFASIQDLRGSINRKTDSANPTNVSKVNSISSDETALETEEQVNEEIEKLVHDDKELEELFSKNAELFNTEFSMVVIDEGHEGTGTELAQKMMSKIKASYKLHLSGTPFNIIEGFEDKEIFNWTYIDERKAAEQWDRDRKALDEWNGEDEAPVDKQRIEKIGDVNPYGNLPTLEIRTINIEKTIQNPAVKKISDAGDKVDFNFRKFFEVETNPAKAVAGTFYPSYAPFVHKDMIAELLDKIFKNDENKPAGERKLFPFGDNHSKKLFAHTLWILPSVDSAVALHEILDEIAPEFHVVNATGDNDSGNALADVQKAVQEHDRTITLSVGKLTTGTTVPEWTGVFLLNNMKSPMNYMQTIFRVKSSGTLYDGRRKEVGYVFDFAPNRTLEMISQAAAATPRKKEEGESGNPIDDDKPAVDELLNYLPIISYDGTQFEKRDTNSLMQTLKRVYIREAVDKGFETPKMFKFDPHTISTEDKKVLEGVKKIIKAAGYEKAKSVKINESELSEELKNPAPAGGRDPKPKPEISEAEKARKDDLKNAKNIRDLLMGVTVRIPLLVMAHDFEDSQITVHNFSEIVDEESWSEFMPKGFRKDMWKDITKFFDPTVFEGACKEINDRVKAMDNMLPLERVAHMANLFSTFKNPDKETVLTPWRVVNMQVSKTLGGLRWVNDEGDWFCKDKAGKAVVCSSQVILDSDGDIVPEPIFVEPDGVGNDLWEAKLSGELPTFYDINSKTALYPLYTTASLFKKYLDKFSKDNPALLGSFEEQEYIWRKIVEDQIFVNVRVDYSRSIAQRVLLGYNDEYKVNCSVVDVVEERNKLKEIKFSEDGVKKPRSLKADEVNKIIGWVLLGVKDKGENSMSVDERFALLNDNVSKALAKAEENDDKFSAVLSNPPYHVDTGGKRHQVYAEFYITGRIVSEKLSMIFPLGWQTSTGRASGSALHPQIRGDKNLVLIDNYYEDKTSPIRVFPEAGTGGVSIVYVDELLRQSSTVKFHEYGKLIDEDRDMNIVKYWSEKTQEIFNKVEKWMTENDLISLEKGVSPWGTHLPSSRIFGEKEYQDYVSLEEKPGYIKCYGSIPKDIGKVEKSSYGWFYIDKKFDKLKLNTATEWSYEKFKVIFGVAAGANAIYRKSFVLPPNTVYTAAFIGVYFNTEEESINFINYLKTMFYRFVIFEKSSNKINTYGNIHNFVPDLSTITNPRTGKVGWDSDWTDEDLKILFKDVLTDDDWEYIEKTALASDGGRR